MTILPKLIGVLKMNYFILRINTKPKLYLAELSTRLMNLFYVWWWVGRKENGWKSKKTVM